MTTGIIVVGKKEAFLIGDGLEIWGSHITSRQRRKLFSIGGAAAVMAGGNSRMLNLVEDLAASAGAGELLCQPRAFFQALRAAMKEDGFVTGNMDKDGGTASSGQVFLFMNLEGQWNVACDWTIFPIEERDSFGSGSEFALGAMRATAILLKKKKPERLARLGMEAAVRYSTSTGGDLFTFVRRRKGKLEFWDEPKLLLESPGGTS